MSAGCRNDDGYSIVEALVALFVFALAAVGLMQMQATSIGTFSRVEQRTLAGLVAQNALVEAMAARDGRLGAREGESIIGGRALHWRVDVSQAPDPALQRIDVRVMDSNGAIAAEARAFRLAPERAQ